MFIAGGSDGKALRKALGVDEGLNVGSSVGEGLGAEDGTPVHSQAV
jgi:hypothetical protein